MNNVASTPKTASTTPAPGGYTDGRFGRWGEPAVAIAFAPSGAGKTSDNIYSFPGGFFVAQKGALKPSAGVVGIAAKNLWRAEARTLDDAIGLAQQIASLPLAQRPPAIIIDDLSLLADNTLQAMEESGAYSSNVFRMWGDLKSKVQVLAGVARWDAGIHVILNAHEQPAFTDDDGRYWRGGPRLPSKKLSAVIPHIADTVLHGRLETMRAGVPWQGVYDCFLSDAWIMKDRHGLSGEGLPMNIGELLRNAGYVLPRAHGLEWQESWVDLIAKSLDAGKSLSAVKSAAIERMTAKGFHPLHVRWAVRDGIDRHAFTKTRANILNF
jgi:hypothetical protein